MKRISKNMARLRVWKPRAQGVLGFLMGIMVCQWFFLRGESDREGLAISAMVAVGVGAVFYSMTRERLMGEPDEVSEGEDRLVVVQGEAVEEILFVNIDRLELLTRRNYYLVRIHMFAPCALGSDITFEAESWLAEYPPWFDRLVKRIQAAKEQAEV